MTIFYVDVPPGHPLTRFHIYPRIRFHSITGNSIEQIYWNVYLEQMNRKDLANEVLFSQKFRDHPENIRPWVEGLDLRAPIDLVMKSPRIYSDIVFHQLEAQDSLFRDQMLSTLGTIPSTGVVRFLVYSAGNDWVYSVGTSYRDRIFGRFIPDDLGQGANMYGQMLDRFARHLRENRAPIYFFGESGSLLRNTIFGQTYYRKTILVLSDSQARTIKKIHHGDVVSVSGGTYQDLADIVDAQNIRLDEYKYIIVHCGVNDVQKAWLRDDITTLDRLRRLLVDESRQRTTTDIIFSTAFDHPGLPSDIRSQGEQHVKAVEKRFAGEKIVVLNWYKRENVFVNDIGGIAPRFFELSDGFHLSHTGVRELWNTWCQHLTYLAGISYTVSPVARSIPPPRRWKKRPKDDVREMRVSSVCGQGRAVQFLPTPRRESAMPQPSVLDGPDGEHTQGGRVVRLPSRPNSGIKRDHRGDQM